MPGLFAYEDQLKKINTHQPPLNKLDQVIEWEMFRKPIEEALYVEAKAPGGRPPYDRGAHVLNTVGSVYRPLR